MSPLDGAQVVLWSKKPPELAHVANALERRGCAVQAVKSLEQVQEALEENQVNLIVAQICRCCPEWRELFGAGYPSAKLPPVLLIASDYDVDLYLDAMSRGAFDCLSVPLNESELIRIAAHALASQPTMSGKGV